MALKKGEFTPDSGNVDTYALFPTDLFLIFIYYLLYEPITSLADCQQSDSRPEDEGPGFGR